MESHYWTQKKYFWHLNSKFQLYTTNLNFVSITLLTFYNNKTKEGFCFIWHQVEGGVTSQELSSIIYSFILQKVGVKSDILLIDGCMDQNRNSTLSKALFHLSQELNITVKQKFLEKGHAKMECDSMHSRIERQLVVKDIYTPAQYLQECQKKT